MISPARMASSGTKRVVVTNSLKEPCPKNLNNLNKASLNTIDADRTRALKAANPSPKMRHEVIVITDFNQGPIQVVIVPGEYVG
jgi:hypothetical protein